MIDTQDIREGYELSFHQLFINYLCKLTPYSNACKDIFHLDVSLSVFGHKYRSFVENEEKNPREKFKKTISQGLRSEIL